MRQGRVIEVMIVMTTTNDATAHLKIQKPRLVTTMAMATINSTLEEERHGSFSGGGGEQWRLRSWTMMKDNYYYYYNIVHNNQIGGEDDNNGRLRLYY
jgi:hypothetical protein